MEYAPPVSSSPAVTPPGVVHSGIPEQQMVQVIQQAPGTAARQAPGTAARQAPCTTARQAPCTTARQAPGTAARQAPGTAARQAPGTAARQAPGTAARQVPGTAARQVPGTAARQVPGTTARQAPGTGARQAPGTTARQAPGTAAQYLQQMYAAQQQHLMLQTTALRQQATRTPPAVSDSQPTPSQPLMIRLSCSPQVVQCPVTAVAPPSSGVAPQAMLLGSDGSPSQAQMYLRAQMLIFTPVTPVSSVPATVSPGATSQVQNLTLGGGNIGQSQPPGPLTTGSPQRITSGDQETASKTLDTLTAQPPKTPGFFPLLQIPPCPLLPVTQVSRCLSSAPVTSQAELDPATTCAKTNGHRASPGACWSPAGAEGSVQRQLLPSISAAAPGASPPAAETPYDRCSSISPSLKGLFPVPATVSISRAEDQCLAHDSALPASPDPHPPLDMTSGNGSSPIPAAATGNAQQNGESKPPPAVVKPQILTHVIEGFVIQEGGQPFPSHRSRAVREVGRSSLLVGSQEKQETEKLPQQQDPNTTTDSEMEETFTAVSKDEGNPPKLKCELCGRVDFEYKFKRSKRFCSMACAKRYNVGCTKRVGLFHPDRSKLQKPASAKPQRRRSRKRNLQSPSAERMLPMSEPITPISVKPLTTTSNLNHNNSQEDSSRCSDHSSYEEPLSPMSAISSLSRRHRRRHSERALELTGLQGVLHNFLPRDPTKWNVEDVYEFIRSLPGCQEISEEFRVQEIDGQALLLLKEDHLMSTMNIKLGPALKLYARISMLKDP
ncbi:polyhomeotic-like protein 2 isoform X2 [Phyllobates terribilis]|uniref:polyhomeotic-like protein 2 isoform X2 n=1 Tax=Phyllobates terribilis TaxID=111132 RepID=UPI003CCA9B74